MNGDAVVAVVLGVAIAFFVGVRVGAAGARRAAAFRDEMHDVRRSRLAVLPGRRQPS